MTSPVLVVLSTFMSGHGLIPLGYSHIPKKMIKNTNFELILRYATRI